MPKRDPKTGRLLPGHGPLNPSGARVKGHREHLRKLLGENGEKAFDLVWQVANGELAFETLARKPGPNEDAVSAALIPKVLVVPTVRERLDAVQWLAEHLVGKAPAELHVESHSTHAHTVTVRDFSRLSDEQLAQLEAGLVAALPPPSDVVDAEFDEALVEPSP